MHTALRLPHRRHNLPGRADRSFDSRDRCSTSADISRLAMPCLRVSVTDRIGRNRRGRHSPDRDRPCSSLSINETRSDRHLVPGQADFGPWSSPQVAAKAHEPAVSGTRASVWQRRNRLLPGGLHRLRGAPRVTLPFGNGETGCSCPNRNYDDGSRLRPFITRGEPRKTIPRSATAVRRQHRGGSWGSGRAESWVSRGAGRSARRWRPLESGAGRHAPSAWDAPEPRVATRAARAPAGRRAPAGKERPCLTEGAYRCEPVPTFRGVGDQGRRNAASEPGRSAPATWTTMYCRPSCR